MVHVKQIVWLYTLPISYVLFYKGDHVTLCMESFMLDQLDEALDLIKKEVTLIPGGTYQISGMGGIWKKDLIEEKLNIKYVKNMEQLYYSLNGSVSSLPN